jgi:pheromone a factor receptor
MWNKNMVLKAPVYCDFGELLDALFPWDSIHFFYATVSHFQAALNVAVPAASLCINRRLYKIATIKVVTITPTEKRRGVIIDLFIGIGLPILQMITRESAWSGFLADCPHGCNSEYIVSLHRYTIFEDIGPVLSNALVVETVLLFSMWPLVIGFVSFVYGSE